MKQLTVKNLRQNGFKVRVMHERMYNLDGISCKGGITTIQISKNDQTSEGIAYCSEKDNYNKKLGVKIALGRAYKALQLNQNIVE